MSTTALVTTSRLRPREAGAPGGVVPLHVSPGARGEVGSGAHGSVALAAALSPVRVDVADSGTSSGGLRLVVAEPSRALADGAGSSVADDTTDRPGGPA